MRGDRNLAASAQLAQQRALGQAGRARRRIIEVPDQRVRLCIFGTRLDSERALPTAGSISFVATGELMRSVKPSRRSPADARMMAS